MTLPRGIRLPMLAVAAVVACLSIQSASAQQQQPPQMATRPVPGADAAQAPQRFIQISDQPTIDEGLGVIKNSLETVNTLQDYSCTFIKREFVDGALKDYEYMFMKIRQEPFSVYTYFLKPDNLRGQEAIYFHGQYNNKLVAHTVGIQNTLVGTVHLDPVGSWAMKGNRHPITTAGMQKLLLKILDLSEKEPRFKQCDVKVFRQAKVDGRLCLCLQITQAKPQPGFLHAVARIYLDHEWNVPVRFEAYEFPSEQGGEPYLVEEYTYTKLQFNRNFTDRDFDPKNPNYAFK